MRSVLAVGLLLLLSAGCSTKPPAATPTADVGEPSCFGLTKPGAESGASFSGVNAYRHVLALTCDDSGPTPQERTRVPGTQGRIDAALFLAGQLRASGWAVAFENFTGDEYDRLEAGSVQAYKSYQCEEGERERMLGLSFSNVVAERGSGNPLRILTAHYDTKRYASEDALYENREKQVIGANDGASGVGVLLELARVLPTTGGATRILLVDGEDGFEDCHPLAGSIFHARSMAPEDRGRVAGVYLLDMVGDPRAHFCLAGNDETLRRQWTTAAQEAHVGMIADAPGCSVYDDHTAFTDLGMKGVDLIDYGRADTGSFPPYWHTRGDTPDKLTAATLGDVGRTLVRLLADVSVT